MSLKPRFFLAPTSYFLLLSIGVCWGFQYILTKIALESFSIEMVTAVRIFLGFLVLSLGIFFSNPKKTWVVALKNNPWKYISLFLLVGFLEQTLPWNLVAWSEKQIPSSFTAILIGTVPLIATFLEVFFSKHHQITTKRTLAVLIGLLGVVLLASSTFFGAKIVDPFSLSLPGGPICALLIAAISFSISVFLIKVQLLPHFSYLQTSHGIFAGALVTALPFLLFSSIRKGTSDFCYAPDSLFALLLLGFLSSGGIVYFFYMMLIAKRGPSFASMANYVSLTVATLLGLVFRGEKLSVTILSGIFLIFLALWLQKNRSIHYHGDRSWSMISP